MKRYFLSLTGLLLTSIMSLSTAVYAEESPQPSCINAPSYADKMGEKALNGLANIGTGMLEIPKDAINTINDSNLILGLVGGTVKGVLNTAGRMTAGLADLLTFWLPTEPIAQPAYIWEDFDATTTYGKKFRVQKDKPFCNETPSN